jgi:ATP-binding cassette, subfamily B, bacterial IrtB/YbtQ
VASVDRLTPAYSAFQSLIDAGVAAVVLAAGLLLTTDGAVGDTTSALIAALLLTTVLFRPQLDVGARALHLPELAASLERVEEWMAIPAVPERPVAAIELRDGGADVRLTRVTAGYQRNVDVIRGLDLDARAGTVTALVGPSGAGKTTVLRLVAGLLSPSAGTVSIGGVDIEQMPATQSAGLVTAVFQDVGVLSGTVATAISSGDPTATRERIEEVARAAHIHDRIVELPHGYDSIIGEEGRTLSGGERQRLGIARALCKDAPVVLLDEATSALDPTNERLLREALASLVRGRTLLVVAHRLETIRNADRIVFVDGGAVVESGTHDELLDHGGRYAAFWEIRRHAAGWSLANS